MKNKIAFSNFFALPIIIFLSAISSFTLFPHQAYAYTAGAFVTTWKTDNPGTSNSNQISIPTSRGSGYNYNVDWGDSTNDLNVTDNITHTYATPGTYTVSISGNLPQILFWWGGDKDKILSVEQWGSNAWSSMSGAFAGCSNFVVNATDVPDLSNVTDMGYMFANATSFNSSINNWNVTNVVNMYGIFRGATSFNQPLNSWNVSSVIDMSSMFDGATSFNQPLNSWNVSNVTNMNSMFSGITLSKANYDAILTSWSALPVQPNVTFDAGNSKYSSSTSTARDDLINTHGWTIYDGGQYFPPVIPTLTTEEAVNIDRNNATLNGTIVDSGYEDPTAYFEYGLDTSYGSFIEYGISGAGQYSSSIESLTCATTYHYRSYATNSAGTGVGNDMTFTTADCPTIPILTTEEATSIDSSLATFNGTMIDTGGENPEFRGFQYGPTLNYGITTEGKEGLYNEIGSFSANIDTLKCGGFLYHYRSYATNSAGTGYGNDQTFTTGECTSKPEITSVNPDDAHSMTVNWNGNSSYYYLENLTNNTNSGWKSSNSYQFTNLVCDTEYSFRVQGKAEDYTKTDWSETFTSFLPCNLTSWEATGSGTITTEEDFESGGLSNSIDSISSPGDLSLKTPGYQDTLKSPEWHTADGQVDYPYGIAVDSDGNIYISDQNKYEIQKFNSDGIFVSKFGNESGSSNLYPFSVKVDAQRNVYVVRKYDNRINKYNSSGVLQFSIGFGGYNNRDGEFYYPSDVAIDSLGYIYVSDFYNNRIQKFSPEGIFITKWGTLGSGDGELYYPNGIAIDSSDNVYVAEEVNQRIQKFDSNGNFITKWGTQGSGDGQFYYPTSLTLDSTGNMYVSDRHNNRIQKFNSDGDFMMTFGWGVTDGANEFQVCTSNCRSGIQGYGIGQFSYPQNGIAVDSLGNIYVANNKVEKFNPDGTYNSRIGVKEGYQAVITNFVDINTEQFSWQDISPLSYSRMSAGSGVINGKIYIVGGTSVNVTNNNNIWEQGLNSLIVYNTENNTWDESKAPMSKRRTTSLAKVIDGKLYVVGGRNSTWDENSGYSSMEIYNPLTDTWDTTKASMSIGRIGPVGDVYNGKLYVVGGSQEACGRFEASGEVYDPQTDTWTPIASAPVSKIASSTGQFINGILYVAGGQGVEDCDPLFSNKLISYNPTTNTWNTDLAPMPSARVGGTSIVIDGKFYYIGGTSDDYYATKDIYMYDPTTNTWETYQGALPTTLHRTSAQMVGDDLYLIGGRETIIDGNGSDYWVATTSNYKINKANLNRTSQKNIAKITWTANIPEGASIELLYSLDGGTTYTSLGTTPGTYDLPEGTTGIINYKAILLSPDGNYPSLDSVSFSDSTPIGAMSGTFTSSIFTTGNPSDWTTMIADSTIPEGASVTYQTRTGETAIPDETWSPWENVTGDILSPNNLYIQVKATLSTTNGLTPVLHSITLNYIVPTEPITEYTLTYIAGPNGTMQGNSHQTINQGSNGTQVRAVANSGYHFVNWSDNLTTATRTDLNIQDNLSVTANFEKNASHGSAGGSTPTPPIITPVIPVTPPQSNNNCHPGDLFNKETGAPCSTTSPSVSQCKPGDLFDTTTGKSCSSVSNNPTTPNNPSTPSSPSTSERTLKQGMTGNDVKALQVYLNTHGYSISSTGPGSLGNETTYFGLKTKQAVIKFQLANGLVGDGVVGPKTREKMK